MRATLSSQVAITYSLSQRQRFFSNTNDRSISLSSASSFIYLPTEVVHNLRQLGEEQGANQSKEMDNASNNETQSVSSNESCEDFFSGLQTAAQNLRHLLPEELPQRTNVSDDKTTSVVVLTTSMSPSRLHKDHCRSLLQILNARQIAYYEIDCSDSKHMKLRDYYFSFIEEDRRRKKIVSPVNSSDQSRYEYPQLFLIDEITEIPEYIGGFTEIERLQEINDLHHLPKNELNENLLTFDKIFEDAHRILLTNNGDSEFQTRYRNLTI